MYSVDFSHPNPLACGPYVARYILQSQGKESWPDEPKNKLDALLHPTFPGTMAKMLKRHGLDARTFAFKESSEAFGWLVRELEMKRPVALFIKAKPLHWIAVLDRTSWGPYYLYDPRVGETSSNADFPMGNTLADEGDIDEVWKGWLWWRYRAVGLV